MLTLQVYVCVCVCVCAPPILGSRSWCKQMCSKYQALCFLAETGKLQALLPAASWCSRKQKLLNATSHRVVSVESLYCFLWLRQTKQRDCVMPCFDYIIRCISNARNCCCFAPSAPFPQQLKHPGQKKWMMALWFEEKGNIQKGGGGGEREWWICCTPPFRWDEVNVFFSVCVRCANEKTHWRRFKTLAARSDECANSSEPLQSENTETGATE